MISIYVTCKDRDEAIKMIRRLLEKKVIAFAKFFPIESMYWWKDEINYDKEIAIIMKTKNDKFKEVENEIKKIHSYKIPCICSWDVKQTNEDYLKWVKEEVK